MSFSHNLALAQKVLKKIKSQVVSSNDIIPKTKLPILTLTNLNKLEKNFGEEKTKIYLKHWDFSNKVRDEKRADQALEFLTKEKNPLQIPTVHIAVTMLGIGECSETCYLGIILLSENGCETTINLIHLKGKNPDGKSDYEHALIVIGDCGKLTANFRSFNQLPDECVLLDPLTSVTGQANQISTLEKDYLNIFQIDKITEIRNIDPKTVRAVTPQILKDAKTVSDKWRKEFGTYKEVLLLEKKESKQELSQSSITQFSESLAISICTELNRISKPKEKAWKFSQKNIYLVADVDTIDSIKSYFKRQRHYL